MNQHFAGNPEPSGSPIPPPDRTYDLCLRDGPRRGLVWRYKDIGVRLTAEGLVWRAHDIDRKLAFSEIESIRLLTGQIPRSGYFGTCLINFRNGDILAVTSTSDRGFPDAEKNEIYVDFVRDLHGRLSEEDRRRINIIGGNTERFQALGWFAVILGGTFFVALPVVLLIITGETKALFLCLAGLFLIAPTLRVVRKNTPRNYNPLNPDEDLFP